jgi:Tfp pilus assembly protein PilO
MNLNSFRNLNIKNKIAINIILFLLANALIVFLLITPFINHIKNLRTNIITEKINLETKIARERDVNLLSEKLDRIEPQLKKFEKIFINSNRELEFITTLEGIAVKNNVAQKINLDLSAAQSEQIYKRIPLELNVQGDFKNLITYLIDLEALSYYLNINMLEFSTIQSASALILSVKSDQSKQPIGNVNLKISADTFWQ